MTKHTPGPWKLKISRYPNGELSGRPYVYAPNGPDTHRHICEPFIDSAATREIQEMQEANACLLSAALELLEACEALIELGKRGGDTSWHSPDAQPAFYKMMTAIAKAKGEA